jgi:hypothetical protein
MSFEVVAECEVAAAPEVVFGVLTDVTRWHEWCTWLAWDAGEMREGARLSLRLTPPAGGGYSFAPTVLTVDAPRHLAWVGRTGLPGVFDGEHHFELTAIADGRTRLVNRERYAGLLSPLFKRLPAMKDAAPGFEAMNQEIARRAESLSTP